MKIVVWSRRFNLAEIIETNFVPRAGDFVDAIYNPAPKVTEVICFPRTERLNQLNDYLGEKRKIDFGTSSVDAFVVVE